jgi:hypothetical protein
MPTVPSKALHIGFTNQFVTTDSASPINSSQLTLPIHHGRLQHQNKKTSEISVVIIHEGNSKGSTNI